MRDEYFSQCENSWTPVCSRMQGEKQICNDCPHHVWKKLELWRIKNHLIGANDDGTDVIGIYPLLPDNTCRFLVFNFDNHGKEAEQTDFANTDDEWKDEVDALRRIGRKCGIAMLTERSRSGRGRTSGFFSSSRSRRKRHGLSAFFFFIKNRHFTKLLTF